MTSLENNVNNDKEVRVIHVKTVYYLAVEAIVTSSKSRDKSRVERPGAFTTNRF